MEFLRRKSIFDILKEAEEDKNEDTSAENNEESNEPNNEADNSSEDSTTNDTSSEEDYGDDEDFSIDTELEDDTSEDLSSDTGSDESSEPDTSDSSSSSLESDADDEPVKANTDIFSSLTKEEQMIKIKELKLMFRDLYCSCDDLLAKINDINPDENNLDIITRISMTMYYLKQYLSDYMTNIFSNKSYIENDIAFNRFLAILNSVSSIINEISKLKNEQIQKTNKK